jgi:L-iditol 2-dehydrogenase
MRALLYADYETMVMADLPDPEPGAGEVLLKVAACGICGSELEAYKSRSPRRVPPLVLGHEFAGKVVAVGPGVAGFAPGQKVVANSLAGCGACVRCRRGDTHLCADRQLFSMHRPGALAQYVSAPVSALLPWPDGLPAEAAALAEPLGNGIHMARLVEHLRPQTALVIGAGPIGLFAQQALQALLGCRVWVTDLSPERLAVAERVGATTFRAGRDVDLAAVLRDATEGEGADVVIDAVGAEATKRQSLSAARPGGAAVWIGLHQNAVQIDSYDVTLAERQVFGTYATNNRDIAEALDLMASGRVDATSWTTPFPLESGVEAFHRMLRAEGDDIKAVVIP